MSREAEVRLGAGLAVLLGEDPLQGGALVRRQLEAHAVAVGEAGDRLIDGIARCSLGSRALGRRGHTGASHGHGFVLCDNLRGTERLSTLELAGSSVILCGYLDTAP